jgi:hypothetical protein
MKRQILHKITTLAVSASIALLGAAIATHSASAATPSDGSEAQLQNASQTQMRCHQHQGDPIGRQCHGGNH